MCNSISISNILKPNPFLFLNLDTMNDYHISDEQPSGNWTDINQFCSILSIFWIINKKYSDFRFSDLSSSEIESSVNTLINFKSMNDQVEYAKKTLKASLISFDLLNEIINSTQKTNVFWIANDHHCIAVVFSEKYIIFYDPNVGEIQYFQNKKQFIKYIKAIECNVFLKI